MPAELGHDRPAVDDEQLLRGPGRLQRAVGAHRRVAPVEPVHGYALALEHGRVLLLLPAAQVDVGHAAEAVRLEEGRVGGIRKALVVDLVLDLGDAGQRDLAQLADAVAAHLAAVDALVDVEVVEVVQRRDALARAPSLVERDVVPGPAPVVEMALVVVEEGGHGAARSVVTRAWARNGGNLHSRRDPPQIAV